MKLRITYMALGFAAILLPLAIVDYVLYNAFLTNGYITNDVVGNIVNYDLTDVQQLCYSVFAALGITGLLTKDYITRKKTRYILKGNERIVSICIGVVAASVLLIVPLLKPSGYEHLLGLIIIFVTLVVLRCCLGRMWIEG